MKKIIVAPVGDYMDDLYVGIKEFPTEKIILISTPDRLKLAEETKTSLEKFKIPEKALVGFDLYLSHVRFEAARDETIWQQLNALPTRLQLPREQVDFLIDQGPKLLQESPDFQRLVADLRADAP